VSQGKATFSTQGPQLTIQTSDRAFINWQSFNIGLGETTSFVQPSSSSLVWNQIHDSNPSQILGNLTANGYVVLQNTSGFYIGGQASIAAHGLLMTTAPTPMPDLSSGGPWAFNAAPPTASIINYGQINLNRGGSAFLLAHNIENHGTISAPEGEIGLYAGKQVLISDRPDGRGLSAKVTLPDGAVDNSGKLIADAGSIAMHAQVVNQGGLIQANSVREVDGTIELVASDAINVGSSSVMQAKGDSQGTSPGGSVTIKSGNTFVDQPGSLISVAGGQQGGNGGQVEISAKTVQTIHTVVTGQAAAGSTSGKLFIDPQNILLTDSGDNAPASGTVNPGDPPSTGSADTLTLNVNTFNNLITQNALSQINLQATRNIEVSTYWSLPDSSDPKALLTLSAGNNITLDDGAAIAAGRNWSINLSAGPHDLKAKPPAGSAGVYLSGGGTGGSSIQTQNGNINIWAANEVLLSTDPLQGARSAIRTLAGGSITVDAQFGDVIAGGNMSGYLFQNLPPYYTVSPFLGGISTAAGGDVNISAGGSVRSYAAFAGSGDSGQDAGTGAFGSQPGNVTIQAGGSVYGHYVLANGIGSITAQKDIGGQNLGDTFALSLIKGSWTIDAPAGNIFIQEVRNPNGIYNETRPPRGSTQNPYHLFDYDPAASVTLNAGNAVRFLTAQNNLPRASSFVPALFAPSLNVSAGAGGIYLADQVTLFPSALGELHLTTTDGGSLTAASGLGGVSNVELLMSDSGSKNYSAVNGPGSFNAQDHGLHAFEVGNPNPVVLNIAGNVEDISIVTVKQTLFTVGGDLINSSFSGQNLAAGNQTIISVAGQIFNSPSFSSVILPASPTTVRAEDVPPKLPVFFDTILKLAVDPVAAASYVVAPGTPRDLVMSDWGKLLVFGSIGSLGTSTGFAYDQATRKLSFLGHVGAQLLPLLLSSAKLTVVRFDNDGYPMVDSSGHFVTDTYSWVDQSSINTLIAETKNTSYFINQGLRVGGPGQFTVHADSISLGDSFGILSCGGVDFAGGGLNRYNNLAAFTPRGADLTVVADQNINLLTSTIASLAGGNVSIQSTGGKIDLGASGTLFTVRSLPLGAFVTGPGNIDVSSYGDLTIDGSRIAAYDGGTVTVTSEHGNVDAGSGGTIAAQVETHFVDPVTGLPGSYSAGIYGSGILAVTLVDPSQVPHGAVRPGDIIVTTPQGNIFASQGGILQEALNGNVSGGPTVTLSAGDKANGYQGNINLGDSGVIGGTVNLTANGNIVGLVISRQNTTVNAAQSFSGSVLAGGSASVSATAGTVSGTIVGVGGASVSGGSGVSAQVLGQAVSVNGGAATSTLGTTAAGTATAASAAGTASTETKEQVVASDNSQNDDQKKRLTAGLVRRTGRVTVILPPSS
jgi:filamentous hemagglutinin family protein